MAKDKDDSDMSPTAATTQGHGHLDNTYASSSDANTPNTLSTEGHKTAENETDDDTDLTEIPLPPPEDNNDKKKTTTKKKKVLFEDPGHADVDYSNRNNLTRLLALQQYGWQFSHGRGPRNVTDCVWCRGPITSDLDMLTHVGKSGDSRCQNSWPAVCLLELVSKDLDELHGYRVKCPMCQEEFCNFNQKAGADFKLYQGEKDILNAPWMRCTLFSPLFVRQACIKEGKQVYFMAGSEAKKLALFGKAKIIFYQCEGVVDSVESEAKRRWLKKNYGENLPFTVPQMQEMGISLPDAKAIAYAADAPSPKDEPAPGPLAISSQFETTWVIIDRGHNEFHMSPFLKEQAHTSIRLKVEKEGGTIKDLTADELEAMAKANGGLKTAVKGFTHDIDQDIETGKMFGRSWLHKMLDKNKQSDVKGVKFDFFNRVKEAFSANDMIVLDDETEVLDEDDDDDDDDYGDGDEEKSEANEHIADVDHDDNLDDLFEDGPSLNSTAPNTKFPIMTPAEAGDVKMHLTQLGKIMGIESPAKSVEGPSKTENTKP